MNLSRLLRPSFRRLSTTTTTPNPNPNFTSIFAEPDHDVFLARFRALASTPPFLSSPSVHHAAVRRLLAASRRTDAVALLDSLKSNAPRDPSSSASLVSLSSLLALAPDTFRQLPSLDLPQTVQAFNAVLSGLDPDSAVEFFKNSESDFPEIEPDVVSYAILGKAMCKRGDFEGALEIVGEMEEKGVAPDVRFFNSLVEAFSESDRFEEVERVWGVMEERRCQPDLGSYNPRLRWLAENGRMEDAIKVFEELEKRGVEPDGASISALIVGHCKDGNLKKAKTLFGRMRRWRCTRNPGVYEVLVPKAVEAGELNWAVNLCYDSLKDKCFVSEEVLKSVVEALGKASREEEGKILAKRMKVGKKSAKAAASRFYPSDCGVGLTELLKQSEESEEKNALLAHKDLTNDVVDQQEKNKAAYCKIGIIVKSFEKPKYFGAFGVPPDKNRVKLPSTRTLITVLRSPHIDKKSREQFEMKVRREYMVIKCEPHELHKKYFWFQRTRILGAQFELVFSYKTRLDMGRLQKLAST